MHPVDPVDALDPAERPGRRRALATVRMSVARSARAGRALALGGAVAGLLACGGGGAAAEGGPPNAMLVSQGAELYLRHCAACHGSDARGDGPAADALTKPPADLTRIAARRGGAFPAAEIAGTIDGRLSSPAHGTREMPIWGTRLGDDLPGSPLADDIVRGRIGMLVDYLRTIQQPAR